MAIASPESGELSAPVWWLREVVSVAVWCYAAVKLLVFDIDTYLVGRFAPSLQWVLDYKAFVILATVSVAWVLARRQTFQRVVGYILAFPLILIFWRMPLWIVPRWALVIVFAPAIHRGIASFRSTFLLYTVGALSALAALKANGPLLSVSLVGLLAFLSTHLRRALRKAYSSSVFVTLSGAVRAFRVSIEKGTFDPSPDPPDMTEEQQKTKAQQNPIMGFYLFRVLAEVVAEKVALVGRGRKYDIYLLCSFLYTAGVTAVSFAFAYAGIHRLEPASFEMPPGGGGFWSFLGYSLGILTTSSISKIQAVGSLAQFVSYLEVGGSVLLLIILFFTLLTAAREAFQADVEEFSTELRLIADAFEKRARGLFQLAGDLEVVVLISDAKTVNQIRRWRGLPELEAPKEPSQRK